MSTIPTARRWLTLPIATTLLVLTTIAAAALRIENWNSIALCHSDEGIYAASAESIVEAHAWNFDYALPFYSPPLFAWLTAVLSSLKGFAMTDTTVVSIALGTATTVAIFALGRRVGGVGLGLAAAALLAFSDLHIALSRTGLPVATLTLWLTLAIWAAAELAPRPLKGGIPRLSHTMFYGLLMGAFLGLAVSTMYIGALAVVVVAAGFLWTWVRGSADVDGRRPYLFTACCFGAAIALATFAAWYWHLEQEYQELGGATEVLWRVAPPLETILRWPQNLLQMLGGLPALRHGGWLVSLVIISVGTIQLAVGMAGWRRTLGFAASLMALGAATVAGSDALLLICGCAGIIPAFHSKQWPRILCALWLIGFLLTAPCFGSSIRGLTPAMPAAILLALAVVWPADESRISMRMRRRLEEEDDANAFDQTAPWPALPWVAGGLLATGGLALLSPFGLTPTGEMWDRWYGGDGYEQFGDRVGIETPADAAVICQGQETLAAYCPREWKASFGDVSFVRGLKDLPAGHATYLALDFRYLEDERIAAGRDGANEAKAAVFRWLHCLEPVAVIPIHPTTLMLLDHLPPRLVNLKVHSALTESTWTDRNGRETPVPPDIRTSGEDIIVLYKVDVETILASMPPS